MRYYKLMTYYLQLVLTIKWNPNKFTDRADMTKVLLFYYLLILRLMFF